ncbi:2Fe-2S iron-sulfur cluster-binding protein [Hoeflea sp. TYP-13]|uniref:2Fe-2S iron-sulfur cluster-binding protein n=1 Tax=Hoeflea sp. TYP-13 TaxID=3230023 RepID=UPI0034C6160F
MSREFHPLTVLDVSDEIGGMAKTVVFDMPDRLKETFAWRAGQHLSVRFVLNGKEERRSYSICSSPVSGESLRITVKRNKDGLVSNHINDTVKKGDVIDVMPPFGTFCLDAAPNLRRTHYFFGAGSGITPLFAMLHSVMCCEPHSTVHLAYGNKNAESILFRESLAELSETHAGRLGIHHVLSAPSMWSGFACWRKGTVDETAVEALITGNPPYAQDAQYYVCGPGGMNKTVRQALMSLDVPANRIHMESYCNTAEIDDTIKGVAATARITLKGKTRDIQISQDQTVLEAARRAGLVPPFSCQSGVCGACRANLKDGSVHMRARTALEDAEIDNGKVLTCQSVPTSERLSIVYD